MQEIDPNIGFSHLPDDVFDEPGTNNLINAFLHKISASWHFTTALKLHLFLETKLLCTVLKDSMYNITLIVKKMVFVPKYF